MRTEDKNNRTIIESGSMIILSVFFEKDVRNA